MPDVSTKVDLCQGHDACPPRAFMEFSPNVTCEGFEMVREGDTLHPHGCPDHPPHTAVITKGWHCVYCNGHRIGYVGAPVSCPSEALATGRPSVRVGDGDALKL